MKQKVVEKKEKKKVPIRPAVKLLRMHGNIKWHDACSEVYQLVKSEPGFDSQGQPVDIKPIPDRRTAYESLVIKYIRYVKSFQLLSECYKWLVHPQKRSLLKRCLEAVAGRICEIKLEMIDLDKSLFNYFDDILFDRGLTLDDLKLEVPKYILAARQKIVHMRERLLSMMLERMKTLENPVVEDVVCQFHLEESRYGSKEILPHVVMTGDVSTKASLPLFSTKINRCPEPICRPREFKGESSLSGFVKGILEKFSTDEKVRKHILLIQRCWRSWLALQVFKKYREKEEISLDMRLPRNMEKVDATDEADFHKRELLWRERKEELQVSKTIEHERFMAAHGHNMAWALKYNITQWLLELRDLQGSFPDYPNEEEGGCERLFAKKTTEEVEAEINEMLNPTPPGPAKEEKKAQVKKVEIPEPEGWKPRPTAAIPKLIDALTEYNSYWYLKEEMDNIEQRFDQQIMMEEVRDESSKQIRLQVDELMRYELDKLRCGIEYIEMANKPPVNKETKTQEKEKVTKDPLAMKTVEELYSELVLQGIVTPVQNITMDDILGDYNLRNHVQNECVPTLFDIKTMLMHLVIFPLSSDFVHSILPLTNRMLFAGSSGTGKTMAIHAVCREIGANLFDISPHVLAGKYQGQQEQEYLMNALLKVGKSMEPSIFMIDDCNALFTKQPTGASAASEKPQRWVSVFSKMMDKMKKEDRIFLFGETTDPFTCNSQAMCDLFKNVVYFPRPDYGSRVVLWREFLSRMPICRSSSNLNPSILAQFSEGYSGQEIENAVNETLTSGRLNRFKPVTNMEFIMRLNLEQTTEPLDEYAVSLWIKWYSTTPLMRKRILMLEEEREALNNELLPPTNRHV